MSADLPRDLDGDPPGDRSDADLLPGGARGDIASGEPGLDALLGLLTAGPTRDELTGEATALAMFRSSRRPAAARPGPHAPEPRGPGPRAPGPHAPRPHAPGWRESRGCTTGWQARPARRLAAAVTLAAAAGLAAAAYTEALPAPLQHAAYGVLGFAGVPDASRPGLATVGPHPFGPGQAHSASHAPGAAQQPSAAASPQASAPSPGAPLPAGPQALSVIVASSRIVAGGSETFTGQLTGHGRAVAGASLSLQERRAGEPSWHPVGSATTGTDGRAEVTVSDLTRNAGFRLAGPHGALSRPVLVIVMPPVSASVASVPGGPGGQSDMLTASSPLASPGDAVVLQIGSGARWRNVQTRRLDGARQATFTVRAPGAGREYRMVLLATAAHGLSLSNTITTPPR